MTLAGDARPYPWSQGCADAITPALRTVVDTEPRPDLVIWLASWDAVDRSLDGRTVKLGTRDGDAVLRREVERASALLTAKGARLIILTVPRPVPGSETVLPGLDEDSRVRNLNALYERAAPTTDGRVAVLDLGAIVCPDGHCPARIDGVTVRPDGSHFGTEGATFVGRVLADRILGCWHEPGSCS